MWPGRGGGRRGGRPGAGMGAKTRTQTRRVPSGLPDTHPTSLLRARAPRPHADPPSLPFPRRRRRPTPHPHPPPAVSMREKPCTFLVHFDKGHPLTIAEISGDDKVSAMKRVMALLLNGEALWATRDIFDHVVRYILPSEDLTVQKLLLLFFEIVCERDAGVFPVVSRYLRKNLSHSNEYVRGITLRFLCRLTDPDLLEPLMASVRENLCHPHHFVRRHALSAVYSIHRLPKADRLLPDAADLVERALATEQDAAARRNAFLFLRTCAQDRAVAYLLADANRIAEWPDLLQMVAIELIPKICYSPDRDEDRYIKIIMSLLSSPSNPVVYECATALVLYSSLPNFAADSYCLLLASPRCENNVKLIVLDRLYELCTLHRDVMVDRAMCLTAIPCTDVDVRRKVLSLVLDLISPQNVEEFMQHLKKELGKTGDGKYRLSTPVPTSTHKQLHWWQRSSWTSLLTPTFLRRC